MSNREDRRARKHKRGQFDGGAVDMITCADRFIHLGNQMLSENIDQNIVVDGLIFGSGRFLANFAIGFAASSGEPRGVVSESLLKAFIRSYEHHSQQMAMQDGALMGTGPLEHETHPTSRPQGVWDTHEAQMARVSDAVEALPFALAAYLRGKGFLGEADSLFTNPKDNPAKADRLTHFTARVDKMLVENLIPDSICVGAIMQSVMPALLEIMPAGYVSDPSQDSQSKELHLQLFAHMGLDNIAMRMRDDANDVMAKTKQGLIELFGKVMSDYYDAFQEFKRTEKPN